MIHYHVRRDGREMYTPSREQALEELRRGAEVDPSPEFGLKDAGCGSVAIIALSACCYGAMLAIEWMDTHLSDRQIGAIIVAGISLLPFTVWLRDLIWHPKSRG